MVSETCAKIGQELFTGRVRELQSNLLDPEFFLRVITDRTESILKRSQIDLSYSGSTEVLLLIDENSIHCAVLGDSRAILATDLEQEEVEIAEGRNLSEDVPVLKKLKDIRGLQTDNRMHSLQLTLDQKPENAEEMKRICSQGGEVRQIIDHNGRRIGPFRVWKARLDTPGLAMSRSLGDAIASQIGVISTPVVTTYTRASTDRFIVVASDGIWDVMSNHEVVQFVEHYRGSTQRHGAKTHAKEISPQTVSIAQLLCEEARVRWLAAVEEEGVAIDDISCIVLEFPNEMPIPFS